MLRSATLLPIFAELCFSFAAPCNSSAVRRGSSLCRCYARICNVPPQHCHASLFHRPASPRPAPAWLCYANPWRCFPLLRLCLALSRSARPLLCSSPTCFAIAQLCLDPPCLRSSRIFFAFAMQFDTFPRLAEPLRSYAKPCSPNKACLASNCLPVLRKALALLHRWCFPRPALPLQRIAFACFSIAVRSVAIHFRSSATLCFSFALLSKPFYAFAPLLIATALQFPTMPLLSLLCLSWPCRCSS